MEQQNTTGSVSCLWSCWWDTLQCDQHECTLTVYKPHWANEIYRALGHFCAHICQIRPGEPPSWGWWDERDDTALQTQDSKFKPWRSEAQHATSRSRRIPTILSFTSGWGWNICVSFKPPRPGYEPRSLAWKTAVLISNLGPPPPPRLTENPSNKHETFV